MALEYGANFHNSLQKTSALSLFYTYIPYFRYMKAMVRLSRVVDSPLPFPLIPQLVTWVVYSHVHVSNSVMYRRWITW